jgi:hypothetical protein
LEARFPGISFQVAPSYEREVIGVSVEDSLDMQSRHAVEHWLREQKMEQQIAPEIWLRFSDERESHRVLWESRGQNEAR